MLAQTIDALRKVGASMRQAGYSSVKLYFQAAMRRQETALQQAVPDLLKKLARRVHRAATRGLPGNKLKTAFDFLALMVVIQPRAPSAPWDGQLPFHGAYALVVVTWFMLREIESASARVGDISVSLREVTLQIPIHKTAQGGRTSTHRAHALLRVWCGGAPALPSACGRPAPSPA